MRYLSLLVVLPLLGVAGDADNDGIPDSIDKCVLDSRNSLPGQDCDTDGDGYGNVCDGDFDQNGVVNSVDFTKYFIPAYMNSKLAPTRGQDMDCNGSVNANDFTMYFIPKFKGAMGGAIPGPSQCTPQ